jgi:hypothetical protein
MLVLIFSQKHNVLLKTSQLYFSCQNAYGWVTTNYCFMRIIERSRSIANKLIAGTQSAKFLGLILDNILSWKNHIHQLMPKLRHVTQSGL